MSAPIRRSGSTMRCIGRRESDSSPIERERAVLEGEQAGQEPRERAGVAAVDRLGGRAQPAQPDAVHDQLVRAELLDLGAQRAHGLQGRLGVGRAAEAADVRLAVGDGPEAGASGARSTCRRAPPRWPLERDGGLDLHSSPLSSSTADTTTP